MSTLLVTGSSGFIGKNLSDFLNQLGFKVELLDAEYFGNEDWGTTLLNQLNKISPDAIFHVGACSNTLESNVQLMMLQNYESTKLISDWCSFRGRKLIYSSSAANYGVKGKFPSNLYGWSKYVAEDYVCKSGGVALRYFNVYGPGEEHKGNMASFLYQAHLHREMGEKVRLFPGGPTRDFVYVKDITVANLYALENFSELSGHFYDVATAQSRSFEEVLALAAIEFSYTEESKIPKGYQFYTCGDPQKWMPGWRPKFPLERGVNEYLKYLGQQFVTELLG